MLSAAILVSDDMLLGDTKPSADQIELVEQMGKLTPAFDAQGIKLDLVRWRIAASEAKDYDVMLPLFVWDYFEDNQETFLAEMAKTEFQTKLLNPYEVLKWNSHKRYLEDLKRKDAPIIRTLSVESVTEQNVSSAFDTLDTDTLVIKPSAGEALGGKFFTSRVRRFRLKMRFPRIGFDPSVSAQRSIRRRVQLYLFRR